MSIKSTAINFNALLPDSTYETKMAALTSKHSILRILHKNRDCEQSKVISASRRKGSTDCVHATSVIDFTSRCR